MVHFIWLLVIGDISPKLLKVVKVDFSATTFAIIFSDLGCFFIHIFEPYEGFQFSATWILSCQRNILSDRLAASPDSNRKFTEEQWKNHSFLM